MSEDKKTGSSCEEGTARPAAAVVERASNHRKSAAGDKKARGTSLEAKPKVTTRSSTPTAAVTRAREGSKSDHEISAEGKPASSSSRRERGDHPRGTGTCTEPSLAATLGPHSGKGQLSKRGNASAGPIPSESKSSSSSRAVLRRTKSSDDGCFSRSSKREGHGSKHSPSSPPCGSSSNRKLHNGTTRSGNSSSAGGKAASSTPGDDGGQQRKKRPLGTSSSSHHKSLAASQTETLAEPTPSQQQPMATPSSRIKTGFEVDAPPRHNRPANAARAGAGVGPAQSSSRQKAGRNHSNDTADLSSSRHRALMEGLTDEQRAWAGIEALLMSSSNDGDNSVDTRDVLPDAIIRAMAANRSVSTLETTCFLDVDEPKYATTHNDGDDAHTREDITGPPGLVDASFSSLKSEATKQTVLTVATAATQNYVLPSTTSSVRQKNALLAPYRPNRPSSMNAYMSQLCTQQHRQNQQQHRQQQQPVPNRYQPQHSEEHEEDPTEAEESIDLFADEQPAEPNHTATDGEGQGEVDNEPEDASNADSDYDDDEDQEEEVEEEVDGDDDESDDQSRILIQQYTQDHRGFSRNHVPDLMNASFSSVRTDMSGLMSLISTAKNYVVQQDDVNPMGVFLGNIARNLERKKEASRVDDDDARVRYMYERDEIADVRRQILEEEIERYHQGEYDGWHHDEGHHLAHGQRPDEISMPSLEPMKPTDDMSPLPSPYSNVTPPFESVRPTPAGDWRAWVDGAFKPGTTTLSPVPFQSSDRDLAPSKNMSSRTDQQLKKVKKKKKPSRSQQPQRSGPDIAGGCESNKKYVVRKMKRVESAPPPQPSHAAHGSRPPPAPVPNLHDPRFDTNAASPDFDEEEVISLSRLRVPVSSCNLLPSDLPRAMPSPSRSTMLGSPSKENKNKAKTMKRKDRNYDPKASPLVSLRQRMARLYTFGKGARRGSPASVLEYGSNGGGGIAAGRGDESRFFPTIEEEDEEDWSNQLLPHHSSG